MTRARRLVFVAFCMSSAAAAACSGTSIGNTPVVTAINDAGIASDGSSAAAPGSVASTQACEAIISYDQRCADNDAGASNTCAVARKKDCGKVVPTMNSVYGDAIVACYTATAACGATDQCVATRLVGVTPTATQAKVRDDYCATCGEQAGPNCKGDFFRIGAAGNGDGFVVLQASDALAQYMDVKCTGPALDLKGFPTCRDAFNACTGGVSQAAAPQLPDACQPPPPPPEPPLGADAGAK